MTENTVRHLIAAAGTTVTLLAWLSGYVSGSHGWWWTVVGVGVIYWTIHKLVDA